MTIRFPWISLVGLLAVAASGIAHADDDEDQPVVHSFPYWSGTVSVELGGDHVFDATDLGLDRNLAKTTIEANTVLHFRQPSHRPETETRIQFLMSNKSWIVAAWPLSLAEADLALTLL